MVRFTGFRPTVKSPEDERSPQILELRIHGIKNTPPTEMLELPVEEIIVDRGDDLGGFWRERHPTTPDVRREGYSWGAMARSDGGPLAGIGQLVVHIGWFLLLPFGLANVAYWTRRIPEQNDNRGWRGGHGAGYVRLFSLGLTLLYVMSLASVSIELIGIQCFRAIGGCPSLPAVFEGLAGYPRALRLAILAAVPLAGVLLLYLLSSRARKRYEAAVSVMEESAPADSATWPVLASPKFWNRARVKAGTERLHVAATAQLLAALLAWDHIFSPYPACERPDLFFSSGCLVGGPLGSVPWTTACLAASALVFFATILLVGPGSPGLATRARTRSSLAVLIFSLLLLVATAAITTVDAPERQAVSSPFLGLVSAPVNLIGILLVIAIAALGWRRGVSPRVTAVLLVLAITVPFSRYLLSGVFPFGVANPWIYVAATGLIVAAQLLVIARARGGSSSADGTPAGHRAALIHEGWWGAGPGVVMLLALGIAVALSTMLVVGVAAWLSPAPGATVATPRLQVPGVWADYALWVIVLLLIFAVTVAVIMTRQFSGYTRVTTPDLDRGEVPPYSWPAYAGARLSKLVVGDPPVPRVLSARRMAGVLQRGEPILGALAIAFGLALALTAAPDLKAVAEGWGNGPATPVDWLVDNAPGLALAILGAIALAAFAAIAANALTTKERPLGLLWDLVCFLPRAGHPFGPPCYSERVVPELGQRVRAWLSPTDGTTRREARGRTVVLSAHSLGAVLATATIFALAGRGDVDMRRVGLITYGTQLRPYFGRFFPELFGAAILGTTPCRGPSLAAKDPWYRQVLDDESSGTTKPAAGSLVDILSDRVAGGAVQTDLTAVGPAWTSLWRRTDYLGFPANGYARNAIDRGASELDRRTYLPTIATHSHYPLAPQYETAFAEVVERMKRRRSGGPVGRNGHGVAAASGNGNGKGAAGKGNGNGVHAPVSGSRANSPSAR